MVETGVAVAISFVTLLADIGVRLAAGVDVPGLDELDDGVGSFFGMNCWIAAYFSMFSTDSFGKLGYCAANCFHAATWIIPSCMECLT